MFKKLKSAKGFTIIEVLIVLAIAGLILLIVFLAVPALQRSQRNNARKTDAARIAAAVNDFVSNNQGTLPGVTGGALAAPQWGTDCATLLQSAGNLGQLSTVSCAATLAATGTASKFVAYVGAPTAITADPFAGATFTNGVDGMLLDEGAQCNGSTQSTVTTPRQAALFYTTETGAHPVTVCLNVQ